VPGANVPGANVPRGTNARPRQDQRAGGGGRQDFRGGGGWDFREADRNHGFESRRDVRPSARLTPRFGRSESSRFYTPRAYRPGFNLGFGIFFGSPHRYSFQVPSYGYGYPTARPGIAYGGISFGISPADAEVYVDGDYVGIVRDFGDGAQPLTLAAGIHRIELDRPGYEPMAFDVNIVPGQLIPYNGLMRPGY
jgi:PEGA domain-containing protein